MKTKTLEINIENGIPIPEKSAVTSSWATRVEPMNIGDSFIFPGSDKCYIYTVNKKLNDYFPDREFLARRVDGVGRIWRTK